MFLVHFGSCLPLCLSRGAQVEIAEYRSFPTKIRAGQLLGRCHAAKGEHAMAVSALDAALQLAKVGGVGMCLLRQAMTVRGRALVGIAAAGKAPHWVSRILYHSRKELYSANHTTLTHTLLHPCVCRMALGQLD